MKEINLKVSDFVDRQVMHDTLAAAFELPDYYGRNLDALYDCLTEIGQETCVCVDYEGKRIAELSRLTVGCLKTMYDAANENRHLRMTWIG